MSKHTTLLGTSNNVAGTKVQSVQYRWLQTLHWQGACAYAQE